MGILLVPLYALMGEKTQGGGITVSKIMVTLNEWLWNQVMKRTKK